MADTTTGPELWDRDQVAAYLGVQPDSVRRTLSRLRVKRHSVTTSPNGRLVALYLAADVRTAHEARPGAGYRSDLTSPPPPERVTRLPSEGGSR